MKTLQRSDIPVIEPDVGGYWEIYDDGRKIWHKDKYPSNYKPNWEDDIELPEPDEIDLINQELNAISQKNTMKLKPPSDFVIPNQDVKTGDFITFLDEGKYNTLPQDPSREVLTFRVKLPSGAEKSISINKTSQIELIKAWCPQEEVAKGMIDSKHWVNKQARVEVVRQKVFDKMKDVIYLYPKGGGSPSVPEKEIPEEPEPPEEG